MKNIIPLVLVGIILAGCQAKTTPPQTPENDRLVTPAQANVFTTIKDAVTNSLVVKCDYVDEDGEKITTYIKGKVVRLLGTGEQEKINGLMKDGQYYLWETGNKDGMVLDLAKLTADGSAKMGETVIKSEEDVIAKLEEQKNNCQLSPADAGMLEIPGDVNFQRSDDIFASTKTTEN